MDKMRHRIEECTILIPSGDYPTIHYTAKKLQSYIEQSLHHTLEIQTDKQRLDYQKYISLGKTTLLEDAHLNVDYTKLNLDGFIIKSYQDHILIDGDSERAVAFGIYDFLERFLGIRFVAFDETYIPTHQTLVLPSLDIVSTPAFSMRCYLDGSFYMELGDQDFAMQKRMNSMHLAMDWKHGGPSSMYGRNNDHNMRLYVPMEKYAQKHPEFYAHHETLQTTVCLTNGITDEGTIDDSMEESVIKIALSELKKDIIANPQAKYFLFEQEDGDVYCQCERCKSHAQKYKRSGILIRFCNILAKELHSFAKESLQRDIDIVTFGYGYTQDAPVVYVEGVPQPIDETVICDEHLIIRLAYTSNAYYSYGSNMQKDVVLKTPMEWNVVAKRFMFWGYDKAYNNYLSYFPSLHNAKQNLIDLRHLNLAFMMMQSSHDTKTNIHSQLGVYLYSKLMWDIEADQEALRSEFFHLYFGEFGTDVQTWFDDFDNLYVQLFKENPTLEATTFGKHAHPTYISLAFLDLQIEKLEAIEVKVGQLQDQQLRTKYLKRLARVKAMPLYSKLYYFEDYYPNKGMDDKLKMKEEFFKCCELGDIDVYRESYPITKINELVASYHFKD